MRIFMTGATGSIGEGVLTELVAAGHEVTALVRSDRAESTVRRVGGIPLRGDLRQPGDWMASAIARDGFIHLGATFDAEEASIDNKVIDSFLAHDPPNGFRFLYTGGCWLYGETGDVVATEETHFKPISAFAFAVDNARRLLARQDVSVAVVHPAMVYHREGGVFDGYLIDCEAGRPPEIHGGADIRWPLIHRDDLARAYRLLIEGKHLTGHFNVSAEVGVKVGEIASCISKRIGNGAAPVILSRDEAIRSGPEWAEGPMLDQQMASLRLARETRWRPLITDYRQSDLFG